MITSAQERCFQKKSAGKISHHFPSNPLILGVFLGGSLDTVIGMNPCLAGNFAANEQPGWPFSEQITTEGSLFPIGSMGLVYLPT